jgi:NhaP-type Na+/H+ or K+/H+ antiporter
MKYSHKRSFIDRESYVAQYIAFTIFTIGIARTSGLNDLLAAFAAGNTISWNCDFNNHIRGAVFTSVIDLVLKCACFIYIGAWLPFKEFNNPELGITPSRLVMLSFSTIAVRRLPAILALYRWIPEIKTWREALFVGHFGISTALPLMIARLMHCKGPVGVHHSATEYLPMLL